MRRSFYPGAVAAVAVAGTILAAPPAHAHTNTCAGTGQVITAAPMYYAGFGPSVRTAFTMYFPQSGACTNTPDPETFSGVLTGNCGAATGSGNSTSGHTFTVAWSGTSLTFAGQVSGTLQVNDGLACRTGATSFAISGTLVLAN
jgi:hypothetical protein